MTLLEQVSHPARGTADIIRLFPPRYQHQHYVPLNYVKNGNIVVSLSPPSPLPLVLHVPDNSPSPSMGTFLTGVKSYFWVPTPWDMPPTHKGRNAAMWFSLSLVRVILSKEDGLVPEVL